MLKYCVREAAAVLNSRGQVRFPTTYHKEFSFLCFRVYYFEHITRPNPSGMTLALCDTSVQETMERLSHVFLPLSLLIASEGESKHGGETRSQWSQHEETHMDGEGEGQAGGQPNVSHMAETVFSSNLSATIQDSISK